MVLYKYCPRCCSLDVIKENNSENYRCRSCNYVGQVNSDSIDQINALRVKVKGGINYSNYTPATSMQKNTPQPTPKPISSTQPGVEGRDYEIIRKKEPVLETENLDVADNKTSENLENSSNSKESTSEISKLETTEVTEERSAFEQKVVSEKRTLPEENLASVPVEPKKEIKDNPFKSDDSALPPHGLRPKETKSLKERLREKGAGKDWDLL
jgi:hypothetical protein